MFLMIKTRQRSGKRASDFYSPVETITGITGFHRIGGGWHALVRVVSTGMSGCDRVYLKMIEAFDLGTVTAYLSMETIFEGRPIMAHPTH